VPALPMRDCSRAMPTSTLSTGVPMGCAGLRDFTASMGCLGVAVQVEFESKGLKPGYHLIGSRVETRRLSRYGSATRCGGA
jgi:hypothetical protein